MLNRYHILKLLFLLKLFFISFSIPSFSQVVSDQSLLVAMEEGVNLMEAGEYVEADRNFKKVLRNLDVLPAEISFYFGKNLMN